jgi:hypothetical protein
MTLTELKQHALTLAQDPILSQNPLIAVARPLGGVSRGDALELTLALYVLLTVFCVMLFSVADRNIERILSLAASAALGVIGVISFWPIAEEQLSVDAAQAYEAIAVYHDLDHGRFLLPPDIVLALSLAEKTIADAEALKTNLDLLGIRSGEDMNLALLQIQTPRS